MGADYEGQEKAIIELRELSSEAKGFLSHHIRNSLMTISGGIQIGKLDFAKSAIDHIVHDLERIGC